MLKSIKITNFCSIGETQEISFEISAKDKLDTSAISISGQNVNLVNCIVGANASGKTTVLKTLSFLFWLINHSYISLKQDEKIPVDAHLLFENELTEIEIEFLNQDKSYKYAVALDKEKIHKESVSQKENDRDEKIFEYNRLESDWNFNTSLMINQNDLLRFKERKNVSVLSSLIATGYLPQLVFIKEYKTNVTSLGFYQYPTHYLFEEISQFLQSSKEIQKESLSFIKDIDIGISDFEFEDFQRIEDGEKVNVLQCVHQTERGKFKLPLLKESNGTVHGIKHLIDILPVLKTGGVAILDEIETGIHPFVAKKIVYLFENPEINTQNAQLIFSTHQAFLLNDRTKTQIFIAEKDSKKAETEIFRLDSLEGVEDYENHFHRYLAGAYGGIPNIKWL